MLKPTQKLVAGGLLAFILVAFSLLAGGVSTWTPAALAQGTVPSAPGNNDQGNNDQGSNDNSQDNSNGSSAQDNSQGSMQNDMSGNATDSAAGQSTNQDTRASAPPPPRPTRCRIRKNSPASATTIPTIQPAPVATTPRAPAKI